MKPPRGRARSNIVMAFATCILWANWWPPHMETEHLQLDVQVWFESIPSFQKIFALYNDNFSEIEVTVAKVVNGLLITGDESHVQQFISALGQRFSLGRFITDKSINFNKLLITQHPNHNINFYMKDDLLTEKATEVPHSRRKLSNSPCSSE